MAGVDGAGKKANLEAAVKHWWNAANAAHGTPGGNLLEAAEAFGVIIGADSVKPKDCEVWQENAEAVKIFVYCSRQWRVGDHGPYGLDYGTIFSMMDLYNVKDKQSVMEDIRIMEDEALRLFHQKN